MCSCMDWRITVNLIWRSLSFLFLCWVYSISVFAAVVFFRSMWLSFYKCCFFVEVLCFLYFHELVISHWCDSIVAALKYFLYISTAVLFTIGSRSGANTSLSSSVTHCCWAMLLEVRNGYQKHLSHSSTENPQYYRLHITFCSGWSICNLRSFSATRQRQGEIQFDCLLLISSRARGLFSASSLGWSSGVLGSRWFVVLGCTSKDPVCGSLSVSRETMGRYKI